MIRQSKNQGATLKHMKTKMSYSVSRLPELPGLKALNFRRIAKNGFGDPGNTYPHSMTWFKDHLYVGTTRYNLSIHGVALAAKIKAGLKGAECLSVWPVELPETFHEIFDLDLCAQIWRYNPRTDVWTNVFRSPTFLTSHGFHTPLSFGFRSLTAFQGKSDPSPALYFPTWVTTYGPATTLFRSLDGIIFEKGSHPGLGLGDAFRGARALVAFKDRLFTAPVSGNKKGQRGQHWNAGTMIGTRFSKQASTKPS